MSACWRMHPNGGRVAAISVGRDAAQRLVERGWLKIDGERAVIQESEPEDGGVALRIVFDRPYPYPHP